MPQLARVNKDTIKKQFGIYDPNEVKHWDFIDGDPDVWEAAFIQMANAGVSQDVINKAYNRIRVDSSAFPGSTIALHLLGHFKLAEPPAKNTLDSVTSWLSDAFGIISGQKDYPHGPSLDEIKGDYPEEYIALGALSLFEPGLDMTGVTVNDTKSIRLAGSIANGCIHGRLPITAVAASLIQKILTGNIGKLSKEELTIYDMAVMADNTDRPTERLSGMDLPKARSGKDFETYDWKQIDFGNDIAHAEPTRKPVPVKQQVPVEKTAPVEEPVPIEQQLPVEEPVSVEEPEPVEEPVPVKQQLPVENPVPIKQQVPIEEPAPVEQHVPVEEPEPVEEPVPVEQQLPVEELVPVEEPEPVEHDESNPVEQPETNEELMDMPSDDKMPIVAERHQEGDDPEKSETPRHTDPQQATSKISDTRKPTEKVEPTAHRHTLPAGSTPDRKVNVPQRVLMEIFNHAGSREQIEDAMRLVEHDIENNTPNAQFLLRFVPGVTQEVVRDILSNRTASGMYITRSAGKTGDAIPHTGLTGGTTYVAGTHTRAIGPVEVPPGFAQENSTVLWDEPVITTMGYPFINFGAPEIYTILKDKDEKRVKEAYKKLKRQLKRVGLSSPIKILKDFRDSKGVRCALNRITVDAGDLLDNGNSTVRATVYPRATSTLKAPLGTVPLTRDFIVEMYKVLSPTRGARVYMDTLGMSEEDYADTLNREGRPPVYIFIPKEKLSFKKAPAGFIARLFTSNSKPTLVETKIGSHFGGFVMPFGTTRLIFTEI